ncbi:hypothetical protein N2152v2_002815 [Parachlorella kessleri]
MTRPSGVRTVDAAEPRGPATYTSDTAYGASAPGAGGAPSSKYQPSSPSLQSQLEGLAAQVPQPLQPLVTLLVGLFSAFLTFAQATWPITRNLGQLAYRLLVWTSPMLMWAGMKYLRWTMFGWLDKFERTLKWASWLLGFLPAAKGASEGAATAGAAM